MGILRYRIDDGQVGRWQDGNYKIWIYRWWRVRKMGIKDYIKKNEWFRRMGIKEKNRWWMVRRMGITGI